MDDAAPLPVETHADQEDASFDFVLELLAELRASAFRPQGWVRFLGRSWRQTQATARTHPKLVRSWAVASALVGAATATACLVEVRWGHTGCDHWWSAPLVTVGYGYAVFDVYVHLGLNNRARGLPLYSSLGWANTLTLARSAAATLLWARVLAGQQLHGLFPALLLLAAGATDVADGAIARRLGQTSRLGQYLDSVADFSLWLALGLALWAHRLLPRWLVGLLIGRWLAPMAVAFGQYFGVGARLAIGSTRTGKVAGIAQGLVVASALLPNALQKHVRPIVPYLHAACAALLVAAPTSQLAKLRGDRVEQGNLLDAHSNRTTYFA